MCGPLTRSVEVCHVKPSPTLLRASEGSPHPISSVDYPEYLWYTSSKEKHLEANMAPAPLPLNRVCESPRHSDTARLRDSNSPDVLDPSFHPTDLDDILQSKSKGESVEFLHLLVEDLRHEVAVLRTQLDESERECARLKSANHPKIQRLIDTKTVTSAQLEALSSEEASNLTIATLTRKIEELSIKNSAVEEEKIELTDRVHDLEGQNEAILLKIGALELQFKAINKTRQKAVQRLTSKERPDSTQGMYGTLSRRSVVSNTN